MEQIQLVELSASLITLTLFIAFVAKFLLGMKFVTGRLNCGIFGASGDFDLGNLKLLGLANESRGGHGCGYYHDGLLVKGVDKAKRFPDFLDEHVIKASKKGSNIFIGHTRKATKGGWTKENTHPFNINNQMVFSHNGTIENIEEIKKDHNVDVGEIGVDSYALGKAILEKGYGVLNEYAGAAAMAFVRDDGKHDGKTLFLFKGAHPGTGHQSNTMFIERPLFVLIKKNCLYYSSIEKSLKQIKEEGDEIIDLDYNTLYRVRNGKLTKSKVQIKRSYRNSPEYGRANKSSKPVNKVAESKDKQIDITKQNFPKPAVEGDEEVLFYNQGRYHIQNKRTYIVASGMYFVNMEDFTVEQLKDEDYKERPPMAHTIRKTKVKRKPYFFFKGAMLKGHKEYLELKAREKDLYQDFPLKASSYAKHPLTELYYSDRDWYGEKGEKANVTDWVPEFSTCQLTIKDGKLLKLEIDNVVSESSISSNSSENDDDDGTVETEFLEERHKELVEVVLTDDEQEMLNQIKAHLRCKQIKAELDNLKNDKIKQKDLKNVLMSYVSSLFPEQEKEENEVWLAMILEQAEKNSTSLLHVMSKEEESKSISSIDMYIKEYIFKLKNIESIEKNSVTVEIEDYLVQDCLKAISLNLWQEGPEDGSYADEVATLFEKTDATLLTELAAIAKKHGDNDLVKLIEQNKNS